MMSPDHLLDIADDLVSSTPKRPRQSNLRRAVSTAYYAMFHCLAICCADTLIGGPGANRSQRAWRQTYRALEHGFAKNCCANQRVINAFPQEIVDFANAFVSLQEKRHTADYDPKPRFDKIEVWFDIHTAHNAIKNFRSANIKDRRAFAVFVLLKRRP